MNIINNVLSRLGGVRECGDGWTALCPAHDDRHPSLSVKEAEDGKILIHCWAGCPTEAVVRAIGLEMQDLFPAQSTSPRRRRNKAERKETAKRQAEIALERRFRKAVLLVSRELAGMICAVNQTLAHGGWEAIMADTPGTAKLTALTHRLTFWEYLADELLEKE